MVALVNAERLAKGQSVLGWFNPTLYNNASVFTHDITAGLKNEELCVGCFACLLDCLLPYLLIWYLCPVLFDFFFRMLLGDNNCCAGRSSYVCCQQGFIATPSESLAFCLEQFRWGGITASQFAVVETALYLLICSLIDWLIDWLIDFLLLTALFITSMLNTSAN